MKINEARFNYLKQIIMSELLLKLLGVLFLFIALALIFTLPTMWLWNYLMPDLFGLHLISFWQALALNVLTRILFRSSTPSQSK